MKRIDMTDEQIDQLHTDYVTNRMTLIDMEKKYDLTSKVLRRNIWRKYPDIRFVNRTCRINEAFFDHIGPEQAYIMGLIASDGYVIDHRNQGKVSRGQRYWGIQLQEGDRDVLEQVRLAIGLENELAYRPKRQETWQGSYTIQVRSNKMVDRLIELGIGPRKSLTLEIPPIIKANENLFWHFLRGLFDGDGCITVSKGKRPQYRFIINGSIETCEYLATFLYERYGLGSGKSYPTKKISRMYISGNHGVKMMYEWLYEDATIWMSRKRDKMKGVLDTKIRRPRMVNHESPDTPA